MSSQDVHSLAPNGNTMDIGAGSSQQGSTEGVKGKVSEIASQAKNTAAEWGRTAATTVDRNMKSAAGALESTAHALRDRAPATGKVNEIATATADTIENTARYLRDHDTSDMVAGLESMVRRNPGAALASALAVGFLIGTSMRRDRDSY
jgi:ElaB/YqjD/DUF883 family membrane-anchored ribosome-binding protein